MLCFNCRGLEMTNGGFCPGGQCVGAACSPLSVRSGDRYIPTRAGSNWSINFHYANVSMYTSLSSALMWL